MITKNRALAVAIIFSIFASSIWWLNKNLYLSSFLGAHNEKLTEYLSDFLPATDKVVFTSHHFELRKDNGDVLRIWRMNYPFAYGRVDGMFIDGEQFCNHLCSGRPSRQMILALRKAEKKAWEEL